MRRYLKRTPTGRGRAVESVVRVGLAQILFTDVPGYAAVNATVELCRTARLGGFTKLVNAIMRRAVDDAPKRLGGPDGRIPNTPKWLINRWRAAYGDDTARAIADAHRNEAPLDIVCRVPQDAADWAVRLDGRHLGGGIVRLWPEGPVTGLTGFDGGEWWVQDVAATLPVRLLGEVAGLRVGDICAAPGGKTLQLAAGGAVVTAVDRSEARLGRLRENLKRTGLTAEVATADATEWRPAEPLDAVLIDAPCSATGTIRRHPDIPWIRDDDDIHRMAGLQGRLLRHAADIVRPGGIIVFCTCSLEPEEGAAQVDAAIAAGAPLRREPIEAAQLGIPGLGDVLTAAGDLRTHPAMFADTGGMDGFFAARLKRA